jgi:hypothetical protein
MTVSELIAKIWKRWRGPAPRSVREEELEFIHAFTRQRWLVKSLLRYRRDGTGAVAEALSEDNQRRAVEQAFVTRMTDCVLSKRGIKL